MGNCNIPLILKESKHMTDWFLALSINKQNTELESFLQFQLS